MRCRRAERLISRAMDSRLPGGGSKDLAAHLAGCPACRSYQTRLNSIQGGAALRREAPVPPGYWDDLSSRVRARLDSARPPGRGRSARRAWRWAWVAVPAAAAGVLISLPLFRPRPPSIADISGSPAHLEPVTLAFLGDLDVAGDLDVLVSADIREETGSLSPYELPDLADDPGFWESLTEDEASFFDREIAEELKS